VNDTNIAMKLNTHKNTVLNAEDKFGHKGVNTFKTTVALETLNLRKNRRSEYNSSRSTERVPQNITQLGELAVKLLSENNLQVNQVRPFFWAFVELYLDRFHSYPFDIIKALISYLEIKEFPKDITLELINQIESEFEKTHGCPLRNPPQPDSQQVALDDEIKELRDSLKYAAMVGEK